MKELDSDVCPLEDPNPESYKALQQSLIEKENSIESQRLKSAIQYSKYKTLPYFSNYYPTVDTTQAQTRNINNIYSNIFEFNNSKEGAVFQDRDALLSQHSRNEFLLKKYYESKRSATNNSISSNNNSYHSNSSALHDASSSIGSEYQRQQKERNMSLVYVDEFLKNSPTELFSSPLYGVLDPKFDMSMIATLPSQIKTEIPFNRKSMSSYFKYMEQLNSITNVDESQINRHRLWIPSNTRKFRESVTEIDVPTNLDVPTSPSSTHTGSHSDYGSSKRDVKTDKEEDDEEEEDPTEIFNTISPSDHNGEDYVAKLYGSYSGIMSTPTIYTENKLPSFIYHCSVPVGDQVFIFGGLVPSYKYDEEAPSLDDFEVDGIEYLPPPLLDRVINNPCMVGNPFVYIVTTSTNHVTRTPLLGQLPPNLLCATASMLNNRYIFLFGGFEIKTKTNYNPVTGKYYLSKRGFVNNVGYIFDTKTFYFTKIEVLLEDLTSGYDNTANFAPRFGHSQVSISSYENQETTMSDTASSCSKPSTNNNTTTSASVLGCSVNKVLIFGGYKQVGDKQYEAMNDLWRIDIPIIMRGKRDYMKFGASATASLVMDGDDSNSNKHCPSKRAFMGYCLMDRVPYVCKDQLEVEKIKNLVNASTTGINHGYAKYNHSNTSDVGLPGHNKKTQEKSIEDVMNHENVNTNEQRYPRSHFANSQRDIYRSFLIHGGSTDTNVYGDLWWFDLNNFKWEKIDLYGQTVKTDTEDPVLVPIVLKLVGHTIKINDNLLTFDGGLNQNDVNKIYNSQETRNIDHLTEKHVVRLDDLPTRSFDLRTQCLFGREVVEIKDDSVKVNVISNSDLWRATYFGCESVGVAGKLVVIGGIYCRRKNVSKMYLRGTMLYAIPVRYGR